MAFTQHVAAIERLNAISIEQMVLNNKGGIIWKIDLSLLILSYLRQTIDRWLLFCDSV